MFTFTNIVLILAATSTALIAGLFYSWTVSVTPGIGRISDKAYLESFQAMNRAILNPAFFATFIGTLILLPLATILTYSNPITPRFWLLLIATIFYAAGVFGVTMAGNVPMNESLDKFNIAAASAEELAAKRLTFEAPWNRLNLIRTWFNIGAVVLVTIALMWRSED